MKNLTSKDIKQDDTYIKVLDANTKKYEATTIYAAKPAQGGKFRPEPTAKTKNELKEIIQNNDFLKDFDIEIVERASSKRIDLTEKEIAEARERANVEQVERMLEDVRQSPFVRLINGIGEYEPAMIEKNGRLAFAFGYLGWGTCRFYVNKEDALTELAQIPKFTEAIATFFKYNKKYSEWSPVWDGEGVQIKLHN